MTDKELRRLGRSELLEMLIARTEENDRRKIRLEQAEAQLRDRGIAIDRAGSLAEAALSRSGVFRAAEAVSPMNRLLEKLSSRSAPAGPRNIEIERMVTGI